MPSEPNIPKIDNINRLHSIKITQLQMVRDRGYDIGPEAAILEMSVRDFSNYIVSLTSQSNQSIRGALSRSYLSINEINGAKRSMLVYYGGKTDPQQKQIPAATVREFIRLIQHYGIGEAILIVDSQISSIGTDELRDLKLVKVQVFNDSELTYNATEHIDTPLHVLLTPEEATAKLIEMKIDISKALIIRSEDPIVRYYGWPVGGLVRVHRKDRYVSILSENSINYRVIV